MATKKQIEAARRVGLANRRHGMKGTPTWAAWTSMRQRCQTKKHQSYRNYGGRGITVCKKWQVFEGFYEDMGVKPAGKSLDRIDNNKGYCKKNCRWATPTEQQNNTRAVHNITWNGTTLSISQWAKKLNVSRNRIRTRLASGYSLDEVFDIKRRDSWVMRRMKEVK